MTMSSDFHTVLSYCIVDELIVFSSQSVETFLNDVVSVEILDERDDAGSESEDDGLDLTWSREKVDRFLNCSGTMHVERDRDQIIANGIDDVITLLVGAELEHFLAEVVTEWICRNR